MFEKNGYLCKINGFVYEERIAEIVHNSFFAGLTNVVFTHFCSRNL